MAKAKGFQGIVGFIKAATWGTAVAAGAGSGVRALGIEPAVTRERPEDMTITGRSTQRVGFLGNKTVAVTLRSLLWYEGVHRLLAHVMGTAGTPATVDTTARNHLLKIKDNLDGIFGTLAYEIVKDVTVHEFTTLKLTGFTIRMQPGQPLELELKGIGHDFKDDSATNTTTSIDTVTEPTPREAAQFRQASFLMNAQSAGTLASSPYFCSGFELTVDRNLEPDFTTEFGDKTSEPQPPAEGFTRVSGSMTFSSLDTAAAGTGGNVDLIKKQLDGTDQKAKLVLTADTLAGSATQKFQHVLWLPHVALGEGKPALVPGGIGWQIGFTAHHVTTAPTGFTAGYVDAVTIENFNTDTVDPLA